LDTLLGLGDDDDDAEEAAPAGAAGASVGEEAAAAAGPADAKRARQPRRRVQLGAFDIFSDDDDEAPAAAATAAPRRASSAAAAGTQPREHPAASLSEPVVGKREREVIALLESQGPRPGSTAHHDGGNKRRRSGRGTVCFAVDEPAPAFAPAADASNGVGHGIDSVTAAFADATLASGGRRRSQRRLSRDSTGSAGSAGSAAKTRRKGTPYAADRPRFTRPAAAMAPQQEGSDDAMDVEDDAHAVGAAAAAAASGGALGSYYFLDKASASAGDEDDDYDLLASTPPTSALAVRRSRRLSHSAAKDVTLDA
jgi:hypothetical protein